MTYAVAACIMSYGLMSAPADVCMNQTKPFTGMDIKGTAFVNLCVYHPLWAVILDVWSERCPSSKNVGIGCTSTSSSRRTRRVEARGKTHSSHSYIAFPFCSFDRRDVQRRTNCQLPFFLPYACEMVVRLRSSRPWPKAILTVVKSCRTVKGHFQKQNSKRTWGK